MLKRAILDGMTFKQVRRAARDLQVEADDYRQRSSLEGGLQESPSATVEQLLTYLSEREVKSLCGRLGVESKGRRGVLIARLIATPGLGTVSSRGAIQRAGPHKRKWRKKVTHGRVRRRQSTGGETPDLRFGPSIDRAGFTPAGIAAFSDLRPAAVVRELIQNSLDAALIEKQEECAHVRFATTSCVLDDIPGIDSYRAAFRRAVEQQKPSGSARAVVDRIERTLASETHAVLAVTDNGIGLDGKRMSALLSDGVSAKSGNAAGTFGNGHSVVVPTSNLRYVLYGGLTEAGDSFGAGQAVLASHRLEGDSAPRSGRGIYVVSFEPSGDDVPFRLVQGTAVPPLIANEIARIREQHGHGAAVIIPAFNNFEHEQSLWAAVSRAAAFNFFQAIHQGHLIVRVEDAQGNHQLDADNLQAVLETHRDEMRTSNSTGAFLSGRKANEAYETLVTGELHEVETSQGVATVRLLLRESGRRSVGLCRNGMWITEDLPLFQNALTDRQPFQALILLSADRQDGLYELIQEAETPLHDKLAPKQMDVVRRRALRQALREIREDLERLIPESGGESYSPEDILAFQFTDLEGQGRGGRQPSFWGQVGSVRPRTTERRSGRKGEPGGPGRGGGRNGRKKSAGRAVVEPIFRIASVPTGNRRRTVYVECLEDLAEAEFRMFVDENVDATCDRQTRAQATVVQLSEAAVNGRRLVRDELVESEDGVIGVKLGSLRANTRLVLETDYTIPAGAIRLLESRDPALRIEIRGSQGGSAEDADGAETGDADG